MERVTGRDALVAVLRAADRPLTASEASTAVVQSGVATGLKGKTPKATLAAQITTMAKKGRIFNPVGSRPTRFALIDDAPTVSPDLIDAVRPYLPAA